LIPRGYCAMSSPDSLESSGTLWVRTLAPEMLRQFESPLLESGVDGRRISARSRRASPSASHQLRPKTSPKTRLSLKSGDGTPRKRKAARRRPDISRATANSRERFRQRGRGPRHRLEGAASPLRALSPNARAAETRAEKSVGRDHRGRSRTRRVHLGNRSQHRAENDRSLSRAANFEAAARTSTPVQGILRRFRERPCRSP
jgi:hypothetical protein